MLIELVGRPTPPRSRHPVNAFRVGVLGDDHAATSGIRDDAGQEAAGQPAGGPAGQALNWLAQALAGLLGGHAASYR